MTASTARGVPVVEPRRARPTAESGFESSLPSTLSNDARDAIAPDLAPLRILDAPRAPEDWPDVTAQPVPAFDQSVIPLDKPLTAMQKGGIFALLTLGKDLGHAVPNIPLETEVRGRRSHRHARRSSDTYSPT